MSNLKCPVCPDNTLTKHNENGTTVDYCEGCGGIWLSKGELKSVVHPIEGDVEFCIHEHLDEAEKSPLSCPACGTETMVKKNFMEYSDISIDFCTSCEGIWLNSGELDAINREIDSLSEIPDTFDHTLMLFLSKLPFN